VMQNITNKALSRIYGHGRGWVFSQIDFFDLGEKDAIAKTLSRAAQKGTIRRLVQGLYDYPEYSKLLETRLPPEMNRVAEALARRFSWNIVPEGSTALHMMGLDTQVPARYFILSSGPNREYDILGRKITFIHRKMSLTTIKDHYTATLVQAIQALGPGNLTDRQRKQLGALRSASEYRKIVRNTRSVTAWVHDEIMKIASCAEQEEKIK
jgi:hypothetical protein